MSYEYRLTHEGKLNAWHHAGVDKREKESERASEWESEWESEKVRERFEF